MGVHHPDHDLRWVCIHCCILDRCLRLLDATQHRRDMLNVFLSFTVGLLLLDKANNEGRLNASGKVRQQLKKLMQSEEAQQVASINVEHESLVP